jgi:hypothetical protein
MGIPAAGILHYNKGLCLLTRIKRSYSIIPNTPRGGVTGNEMGDIVVSN